MTTQKTEKIDKRAAALRDNLKRRKLKAKSEKVAASNKDKNNEKDA